MTALHTTIGCLSSGPDRVPAYDYSSAPYRAPVSYGAAPYRTTPPAPYVAASSAPFVTAPSAPFSTAAAPSYETSTFAGAPTAVASSAVAPSPLIASAISAAPVAFSAAPGTELPGDLAPLVPERAWKYIVVHHSATTDGDVRSIDGDHRGRKDSAGQPWLGIGYHFVIGNGGKMGDGEIQATFRWRDQLAGAHAGTRQYNEEGIGICLIGDFDRASPTPKQMAAVRRLSSMLAERYGVPRTNWKRHSDVSATECPGRLFPWGQFVGQ